MPADVARTLTPPALCLLYAAGLLACRPRPIVTAHWLTLLQLPRVAVFALAAYVGLRGRARGGLGPSQCVGVALGLLPGVAAAGGLWGDWGQVQILAAVGWLIAASMVALAR